MACISTPKKWLTSKHKIFPDFEERIHTAKREITIILSGERTTEPETNLQSATYICGRCQSAGAAHQTTEPVGRKERAQFNAKVKEEEEKSLISWQKKWLFGFQKMILASNTKAPAAPVKTNTKIWKEYTDSLVSTLKAEVLNSKKVKKETYFLTVDYEINTDGSVNITNVISTPENAYIQSEVKNRIELTAPQLAPVLDSNKQPRKVKRKHNFSITKE